MPRPGAGVFFQREIDGRTHLGADRFRHLICALLVDIEQTFNESNARFRRRSCIAVGPGTAPTFLYSPICDC